MVKYYCNFCGAELTRETTCRVGISSTGAFTFSHMDRLRKILEPYLRLENAEYCGEIIEWKEEKQE